MPFIEGEKLTKLYKEIDDERNASSYFRALHQSTKKKIAYVKVYAVGFYILLLTVIVLGILFLLTLHRLIKAKNNHIQEKQTLG